MMVTSQFYFGLLAGGILGIIVGFGIIALIDKFISSCSLNEFGIQSSNTLTRDDL